MFLELCSDSTFYFANHNSFGDFIATRLRILSNESDILNVSSKDILMDKTMANFILFTNVLAMSAQMYMDTYVWNSRAPTHILHLNLTIINPSCV